jgi:hypothetical protein
VDGCDWIEIVFAFQLQVEDQEVGPAPVNGGDELAAMGQFGDKHVSGDPLQILSDRRVDAEVVIEQD